VSQSGAPPESPAQFSWIDHRLVQENYFLRCDHSAWTLYLFLDQRGRCRRSLSYYSDGSLMRRLKMEALALSASPQQLIQAGLIAYEKPLYQVLSLEPGGAPRSGPIRVGELLRRRWEVSHDRLSKLIARSGTCFRQKRLGLRQIARELKLV